jgi:NAD(P)-dependent dehydrogenase (short-subunit alcohol dehydrogenase family)
MAKQPRPIHGKVVAITGGARGIGRATARALLREGARVAIGDLDSELARRTAEELGGGCIGLPLDVTDRASFESFIDRVESALGPLDVLVNNAGIMPLGPFHEESDETAIRQIDINLHGVITGTKLALARMRPRRSGHIVNLASYAGRAPFPGGATYVATKHAVVGLTYSVWLENREQGIELSAVMPGVVNTELAAGLAKSRGFKPVEPEDVADAIVEALRHPRVDVYVPRSLRGMFRLGVVLPTKGGELLARIFKGDRVLVDADFARRATYEARAARSEPAVTPEGEARPDEKPARVPEAADVTEPEVEPAEKVEAGG